MPVSCRFHLLTTDPGLEQLVESEVRDRLPPDEIVEVAGNPLGRLGWVGVRTRSTRDVLPELLALRTIHHVVTDVRVFGLDADDPLGALEHELARGTDTPALAGGRRFRVTTHRIGSHDFTSMDVQRVAGAALSRRYAVAADMKGFDVEVRVDVVEARVVVGWKVTRTALTRRHPRPWAPPASLKPNLAYAMLRSAGLPTAGLLVDPCCGSGTILMEAADVGGADLELFGSDIHAAAVRGARRNLAAAGRAERVTIEEGDCRQLERRFSSRSVHAIVTNPPHGVRLGRRMDLVGLYRGLLGAAMRVLRPDGALVVLVLHRERFCALARRAGMRVTALRDVENGGLSPSIVVARPAC